MTDLPLGKSSDYPQQYAPEVLVAIDRGEARRLLGLGAALPFSGEDVWNAWELTWLDPDGRPRIATAEIRVDAGSPNLVESKSLKLYLNGYAMERLTSPQELGERIASDLCEVTGLPVAVTLQPPPRSAVTIEPLPGDCIDDHAATFDATDVDPSSLSTVGRNVVRERLHTHLLRSLCPVTGQPDFGSVVFDYRGPKIDRGGLLRYVASYRRHRDFHEACVERMFLDVAGRCDCERLSVIARFNRRGGIDINPYRTNDSSPSPDLRTWRQ